MAENKTKIIITRNSQWAYRLRSYKVLIDGIEAGWIKNGSSEEFIVTPGRHKVRCSMNWLYSTEFTVNLIEDEIAYLRVKNAASLYWPLYFLLIAAILLNVIYNNPLVRPHWVRTAQLIAVIPFLLYALYFNTIGRKRFFALEEDPGNVFAKN